MTYASNPADYELDTVAQGVNITRMISQLLVTFLNGNQAMDEVNSYVGSVSEGGLRLSRDGDTLTATYTFAEQGFVIPVRYSLTADALSASIDYGQVRETGDCRILDITLLPFFGAGAIGGQGLLHPARRLRRVCRVQQRPVCPGRVPPGDFRRRFDPGVGKQAQRL